MQNPTPKVTKDTALKGRKHRKATKDSLSFLVSVTGTKSPDGSIVASNGIRWKV